ncbi:MAG: hypothetical protein WA188_00220 [Terriglobales bacterium]
MIDDSADRDREKVIISAALIGDKDRWQALRIAWRKRLDEDGLEYFKSSQCRHLRRQFFKYRDQQKYPPPLGREAADRVQADLDQIIHDCRLMGVGAIIPVPLYRRFQADPQYAGVCAHDPYEWAVQTVWMQCVQGMQELGRGHVVTFAHDDCSNFHLLDQLYKGYKQANRKSSRRLAGFSPLEDKTTPPIQAADVAASVTHRYAVEWIDDRSTTRLQRLMGTMYRISIWDDEFAKLVLDNEVKRRAS